MIKANLIIKEPKKPLFNRVIVSLLYASLFTYTIFLFTYKDLWNHSDKWTVLILLFILLFVLFSSTFMLIASHSIHISSVNKKIRHQYNIGLFTYKEVWQDLIEPQYISIFKNGAYYLVNLWYEKNGILNLMALKNKEESIEKGLLIAEKLNIDLLDATVRNNFRWIDKKASKKEGKVIYSD